MKKLILCLAFAAFGVTAYASNGIVVPSATETIAIFEAVNSNLTESSKVEEEPCTYCMTSWRGMCCACSPDSCQDAVSMCLEFC